MISFKGTPAEIEMVAYCGTASMIQKELQTRRNNCLKALRGVQVVARYRVDSACKNTIVITFSHREEMGDERKTVIREILQDEAFNCWLRGSLSSRHGWGGLRIRVTDREKPEEYVWSVEKTTG
jgi:hypothetical protein